MFKKQKKINSKIKNKVLVKIVSDLASQWIW